MSKHSLISTVAGLGLMAASMGASAQMQTFDYGMMFYGNATGGGKYVAFVPTIARDGAGAGAANVLMLELFQPASGSASTWAYAIGGPVNATAGGAETVNLSLPFGATDTTGAMFLNSANASVGLAFLQNVVVSSQACNVTFNAEVATDGQLRFFSAAATPSGALAATALVSFTSGAGTASATGTIASAEWNAGSATLATISGGAAAVAGLATNPANSSAAIAAFSNRNKCVAAYTARAQGGTPIIGGGQLGMIRIW
ncbi:hypothetical protein [Acidovorax sp. ST3]|uniref:hypothetical protein n=1 Tax=Acidovorax sp. ST3 TaxID=2219062 RepID=UPI001290418D|nr:hypothetical protein [Acidovorax sp. ST3]